MEWWLAYLAIGLAVGFFAGLLGIGGGAVMVPMLVLVFHAQGLPEQHIMHIALGTAMATIILPRSLIALFPLAKGTGGNSCLPHA